MVDMASILQALFANNNEQINEYEELKAFWTNHSAEMIFDSENYLKANLKAVGCVDRVVLPFHQ